MGVNPAAKRLALVVRPSATGAGERLPHSGRAETKHALKMERATTRKDSAYMFRERCGNAEQGEVKKAAI